MTADAAEQPSGPGRWCPAEYSYRAVDLATLEPLEAETLYVIGGLYGNLEALDVIESMAARESGPVTLVFNGDFHWFDTDVESFSRIEEALADHVMLRGNVETELTGDSLEVVGCGCGYPEWVDDATVAHSNTIITALAATAAQVPGALERLAGLPMVARAQVGDLAVGIVHGGAESLAGWGFSQERVNDPVQQQRIRKWFAAAAVGVFASSHTCLPVALCLDDGERHNALLNNGAAGMPNFAGDLRGVITRISVHPSTEPTLYGARIAGAHLDALPVHYDVAARNRDFLINWPAGSAAHDSYFSRLTRGPNYRLAEAVRHGVDQKQKCWYSHLSERIRSV